MKVRDEKDEEWMSKLSLLMEVGGSGCPGEHHNIIFQRCRPKKAFSFPSPLLGRALATKRWD